jgi:hypothetical protein
MHPVRSRDWGSGYQYYGLVCEVERIEGRPSNSSMASASLAGWILVERAIYYGHFPSTPLCYLCCIPLTMADICLDQGGCVGMELNHFFGSVTEVLS